MSENLGLFYELFSGLRRLAPGLESSTLEALSHVRCSEDMRVADLGCGVGNSTLVLAENIRGQIIAIDNHQPYLDALEQEAVLRGTSAKITAICSDMAQPPITEESLDLIWAEGSIYLLGFPRGLELWRRYLKPGGWIALTEITWLCDDPSPDSRAFWGEAYPGMTNIAGNLEMLRKAGFTPQHQFALPAEAWEAEYYQPLEQRLEAFSDKYAGLAEAEQIIEGVRQEISIKRGASDDYSYVFYVAQRAD